MKILWVSLFVFSHLHHPSLASTPLTELFDDSSIQVQMEKGRRQMDSILSNSKMPRFGECWISALENLNVGCRALTEDVQARLAFAFASCFNQMMGLTPYLCTPGGDIKDCVRGLDSNGLNTFRDYFLHTQDMCFYLQHQVWQQETQNVIKTLSTTASDVSKGLEDAKTTQEKILDSQQESLKVQADLLKENGALYNLMVGVKNVFDDFKHSADEHRMVFIEIFEKLTKMQQLVSWIQGEMSLLDMIAFYFVSMVFGFIATATPKTKNARFYLVLMFMVTLYIERQQTFDEDLSPEGAQEKVWLCRKVSLVVAILIISATALTYRDYHQINNQMLRDISHRLDMLRNDLTFDKDNLSLLNMSNSAPIPILDKKPSSKRLPHLRANSDSQDETVSQSDLTEDSSEEEEEELHVDHDGSLVFRSKLRSYSQRQKH